MKKLAVTLRVLTNQIVLPFQFMAAGRPVSGKLAQALRCYRSGEIERYPTGYRAGGSSPAGIRVPAESGDMTGRWPVECLAIPSGTVNDPRLFGFVTR